MALRKSLPSTSLGFDICLDIPDVALGAGEAMRRRELIRHFSSTAVASPLTARASAMPVVAFLCAGTPADDAHKAE
jgi:hypothetical protein